MRKVYFLIAITGIFFLYSISFFYQPEKISLGEIWKYDGKEVIVEGEIKNIMGETMEISDGNATAKIYWENNKNLEYGDFIRAEGKVGEYGNDFAVYAKKVRIIKKWDVNCTSLPYLAENYEKFVGKNVNVSGYIYSKSNGYFYLTDQYLNYKIKVYCNHTIPFNKYDRVYVKALMLYDPHRLNFYLKICRESHGVVSYE